MIYNFETSQPLTDYQLEFLNAQLQNIPTRDEDNLSDIPEWITDIEPENEEN